MYYKGTDDMLAEKIHDVLNSDIDVYDLPLPDNAQVVGKYNEFIPRELLKKQFAEDYLDLEGLRAGLCK